MAKRRKKKTPVVFPGPYQADHAGLGDVEFVAGQHGKLSPAEHRALSALGANNLQMNADRTYGGAFGTFDKRKGEVEINTAVPFAQFMSKAGQNISSKEDTMAHELGHVAMEGVAKAHGRGYPVKDDENVGLPLSRVAASFKDLMPFMDQAVPEQEDAAQQAYRFQELGMRERDRPKNPYEAAQAEGYYQGIRPGKRARLRKEGKKAAQYMQALDAAAAAKEAEPSINHSAEQVIRTMLGM